MMKRKAGFTLTEIMTAVAIVTILVTMAVPLYERVVERSRLAQARTILAKLQDAKLHSMDNMECPTYTITSGTNCPRFEHLNVAWASSGSAYTYGFDTDDFHFSIFVTGHPNGVCAKRRSGDYQGTTFVYVAPGAEEDSDGKPMPAQFLCYGTHCPKYGHDNASGAAPACNS